MEQNVDRIVKDTTRTVMSIRDLRETPTEVVAEFLEKLLIDATDVFNLIGSYQTAFFDGKEHHMSFYYDVLDALTGAYMYLSPITSTLKALEKNRSVRFFHAEKIACEKAGNKFVQGATERASDNFVQQENYIKNIFDGYLDSCMVAIQTCRTRIREVETEK